MAEGLRGLWWGIEMRVSRDEPTTEENNVKRYAFGWTDAKGRARTTTLCYLTMEAAVRAADAYRKTSNKGNTDFHVFGRAFAGWA